MKLKKIFIFCYFVSVVTNFLSAQGHQQIPSEKPKLIIEIVLDDARYDDLVRFRNKYCEGGFKRLMEEGTFCYNANFNYMLTQSAPGYTTISTGSNPSDHGIIADSWYLRLRGKRINATDDDNVKTIGGGGNIGRHSPRNLTVSTLGDELKLASHSKSKVIGISLKPDASILLTGHRANEAYWYDDATGNWITSSYYTDTLPRWVNDFNTKKMADIYLNHVWEPLLPASDYTESLPDDNKYETGINDKHTFPYPLNNLSKIKDKYTNYEMLKYTPFGNTYTKDMAIAAIANENLGKGDNPDLLIVNFSTMSYINEKYGNSSVEMEDTYLRLDKDLEHFIHFIDDNLGKENTLIVLTSDHGVASLPAYLSDMNLPVDYFNANNAIALLKSYLNVVYGKGDWVKFYNNRQIYLNHNLIEDSKISLKEMQEKVSQFIIQFSGVANVITASTLQTTNFTRGITEKMQNSYNQKYSGDVLINLQAGWIEKDGKITSGNSPYSYDTHVPLIWYGWKIKRADIAMPVDMTDIAPTLSSFLNIAFPNSCSGNPILKLME